MFASTGGSLTKLAYYSTVQHKVAKVRSFDHTTKVNVLYHTHFLLFICIPGLEWSTTLTPIIFAKNDALLCLPHVREGDKNKAL